MSKNIIVLIDIYRYTYVYVYTYTHACFDLIDIPVTVQYSQYGS
jgi:hypothetical protein